MGRFFRGVADQGPRKGEGGSTRQGLYCLTAGGRLLAYRNVRDAARVRSLLEEALEAWRTLPEQERAARDLESTDQTEAVDPRYDRSVPEGALVVRVHAREMDLSDESRWCRGAPRRGLPNRAALDHLWLTESDRRSLAVEDPVVGRVHPVPAPVVRRLVRFHLVDNTRGEPPMWRDRDVRRAELRLVVDSVGPTVVLRLEGRVHLETPDGKRGYVASLRGYLAHDVAADRFTRFDVLALGEHWGHGRWNGQSRPGRSPLGIAFTLADLDTPADRVPPQAARDLREYLGR